MCVCVSLSHTLSFSRIKDVFNTRVRACTPRQYLRGTPVVKEPSSTASKYPPDCVSISTVPVKCFKSFTNQNAPEEKKGKREDEEEGEGKGRG